MSLSRRALCVPPCPELGRAHPQPQQVAASRRPDAGRPVFIFPSLAVSQVNNMSPRKFTHKRFCNSNIYLVRVPFIFGKKLQTQTILSDLRKTVISTFPVIMAPFCRSGESNNGG